MRITAWDDNDHWMRVVEADVWEVEGWPDLKAEFFNGEAYVSFHELRKHMKHYTARYHLSYEVIDAAKPHDDIAAYALKQLGWGIGEKLLEELLENRPEIAGESLVISPEIAAKFANKLPPYAQRLGEKPSRKDK